MRIEKHKLLKRVSVVGLALLGSLLLARAINASPLDYGTHFNFAAHKKYCQDHAAICARLPANMQPQTVIVIHGMNASMDSAYEPGVLNGHYVRMLKFIAMLGKNNPNFRVYGINYNSSGVAPGEQPVKLVEINSASTTCDRMHGWQNCWNVLETSSTKFSPGSINIRKLSQAVREILIKAADDSLIAKAIIGPTGKMSNSVTVIGHSMGGLVLRDLLYNGEGDKTGYELLMAKGIWINEYVSLGTPHNNGLIPVGDMSFAPYYQLVAQPVTGLAALCKSQSYANPIFEKLGLVNTDKNRVNIQYCMIQSWDATINDRSYTWQDGTPISISKEDFPQIHWVFVAGIAGPLPAGVADPTDPNKGGVGMGDGAVHWKSAQYMLNPYDTTKRADENVFINEHPDSPEIGFEVSKPGYYARIGHPGIPSYNGGYSTDNPSYLPTYSGFVQNSNAVHAGLTNVGYFFGGDKTTVQNADKATSGRMTKLKEAVTPCMYTDDLGDWTVGAKACVGYFQYVIPSTSLCHLPNYNSSMPYFGRNPQFWPSKDVLKRHVFEKICDLHGFSSSE